MRFPLKNKYFNFTEIGYKAFLIGIFFLASAPSLALLFMILPVFCGLKRASKNLIKDNSNYLIFIAAIIMITKSIYGSFLNTNKIEGWDSILNWAGLGNWIPLFIIYFGVQLYVQNEAQRTLLGKTLILGTVPVIFSCFSQYFLNWFGPYELFNGFIIWYQRVSADFDGGGTPDQITGLFNNPNYAGAWLVMTWPFLLSYLSQKRKDGNKLNFIIVFFLSVLFIIAIILINSRGAFLGILSSIPLIFGNQVIIWFFPLVIIISASITLCNLPIVPENIKNIFCFLIPNNILSKLNDLSFNFENYKRFLIWEKALNLIINKPFFGWGAASFPVLYFAQYGEWIWHPHNLFLELSISYGLITSLLVFIFIGILLFKSFRNIYKSNNSFEKAWFTSIVVFLIHHSFDVVYFDARISTIFWVLLAGLKGISNQQKISNKLN